MIDNKELDIMIKNCKTPKELQQLQTLFANEIIGRITDKQAMKILKRQKQLEEREKIKLEKHRV